MPVLHETTLHETAVVWVVLDPAGEVLLLASGSGAPEIADEWRERGCTVLTMSADEINAA